jgi:hypothetical protein
MSAQTSTAQSQSLEVQLQQAMGAMDFSKCQEIQSLIIARDTGDAKEAAEELSVISIAVEDAALALHDLKQTKGAIIAYAASKETEIETTVETEVETEVDTKEVLKAEKKATKVAEKAAKEALKAGKKAAKEALKAEKKAAKEALKAEKKAAKEALKAAKKATKKVVKKPKVKKTKKVKITAENRCVARLHQKPLNGLKQCSRVRKDGSDYCTCCHKKAHHTDRAGGSEMVGPDLWKWCAENGKGRKDTKGDTAGLWFGRIDQFETLATSEIKNAPVTSFQWGDERVVVMCYPDNEHHDVVAIDQIESNSILGHKVVGETWPKKWHPIGVAEKKRDAAVKTAALAVATMEASKSQDPFRDEGDSDSDDDDDESREEMPKVETDDESREEMPKVETDDESREEMPQVETDDSATTFVKIKYGDYVYTVIRGTRDIYEDADAIAEGPIIGKWTIVTPGPIPDCPSREWLQQNGKPDEAATECVEVGDSSEDSEDSDSIV